MLKRIGLPMMALFGVLALAPLNQAKAAVRFGVYVGAPVYNCPLPPPPVYYGVPAPVVPAPAYVYGYTGWDRHVRREVIEHRHDRDGRDLDAFRDRR